MEKLVVRGKIRLAKMDTAAASKIVGFLPHWSVREPPWKRPNTPETDALLRMIPTRSLGRYSWRKIGV